MKCAFIADIHANLEALQAVLHDIERQKCTHVACLGDIVGYCANPNECLDPIRAMNVPCVKGNHDEYCASDKPVEGFTRQAAKVINWTRNQVRFEDKKWLSELDYVQELAGFSIVHATLDNPPGWGYVLHKQTAAASFACQRQPVCFFGHTHVPVAFVRDDSVHGGTFSKFQVERGRQYFIGVGSVGQPRDGNPQAAYVIYDMDQSSIELRRLNYDVAAAQKKMADAGLL